MEQIREIKELIASYQRRVEVILSFGRSSDSDSGIIVTVNPREQPEGVELIYGLVWIEYWIGASWRYQISCICHNSLEFNLRHHGIFDACMMTQPYLDV